MPYFVFPSPAGRRNTHFFSIDRKIRALSKWAGYSLAHHFAALLLCIAGLDFSFGADPGMSYGAEHSTTTVDMDSAPSTLPVLTIDQAIRQALEHNPALAGERARINRDQARAVQSGELPDPKLVVGEQYFPINFNLGASVLTMTTVGIRQDFAPWGKRDLLRRSSTTVVRASRWDLDDQKNRLVRDIRILWADLYLDRKEERSLRKTRLLWEKVFRVSLARYRQGTGSASDVLSAQFQKDSLQDKEDQLRIRDSKYLNQLMERMHTSRPFRISDDAPLPGPSVPYASLVKRLDRHPALQRMKSLEEAQKLQIRAARKDKIPAVSVEGDYSYFMGPNLITQTPNLFSLLLSFNLPVRPGERQDQRIAEEENQLEIRVAEQEHLKQHFLEKIRETETIDRLLEKRIRLYDRVLLPEARRNMEAVLAGYSTGTLKMEGVLSAMQNVQKVEIGVWDARSEHLKSRAELAYLSGIFQGGIHEP